MDVKQFKLYALFFLILLDETTSQFVWLLPIMHTFFPYDNMHPVHTQRRPKFVILTAEMFFPSRQFAVSSTECNCLRLVIINCREGILLPVETCLGGGILFFHWTWLTWSQVPLHYFVHVLLLTPPSVIVFFHLIPPL